MGLFGFLKQKKEHVDKLNEMLEKPDGYDKNDPIWNLRRINDIVVAVCNRLTGKTNYGENMEVLSEEERIFYVATEIDSQVNSLGFDYFFADEAGRFAMEAPAALRAIGAENRAEITEKAIALVGGTLPADHKERAELIRYGLTEEAAKQLDEYKKEYEEIEDDFNRLLYFYLSKYHYRFTE